MKKNVLKRVLSSVCAFAMAAAPFSAMAAAKEPIEHEWISASITFYNLPEKRFNYTVVNDTVNDFYTISGDSGEQLLRNDEPAFSAKYTTYGGELGNKPQFFNMLVQRKDENNNITGQCVIRNQYFMYGDVNCDGKIDMDDAGALADFIHSDPYSRCENIMYWYDSLLLMMDYNHDDVLDIEDCYILLSYIEGDRPDVSPAFGSMGWATIHPDDAKILGLGDYGKRYMSISKDAGGEVDAIFNIGSLV